jgi:hypothetical protein
MGINTDGEVRTTAPQMRVRTGLRGGQTGGGYVDGQFFPDKSGVCGETTTSGGGAGGYVGGVFFPDKSGVCGGTTTPTPPPTSGGGYVGGQFFPDKSGTCV